MGWKRRGWVQNRGVPIRTPVPSQRSPIGTIMRLPLPYKDCTRAHTTIASTHKFDTSYRHQAAWTSAPKKSPTWSKLGAEYRPKNSAPSIRSGQGRFLFCLRKSVQQLLTMCATVAADDVAAECKPSSRHYAIRYCGERDHIPWRAFSLRPELAACPHRLWTVTDSRVCARNTDASRSSVCQVLQKPSHLDRADGIVIPPEPPVVAFHHAGTERSGQGRACFWRGLRTLAREHRSGTVSATTGGSAGDLVILLVSSEMGFSCRLPHLLLLVLFEVLHIQIPRRFDPVLMHLHR